jgi:hypothetical protein
MAHLIPCFLASTLSPECLGRAESLVEALNEQLPALLCVPCLWAQCHTLRLVATRIWRRLVLALAGMTPEEVAAVVPPGKVATLMGNLTEAAVWSLKVCLCNRSMTDDVLGTDSSKHHRRIVDTAELKWLGHV